MRPEHQRRAALATATALALLLAACASAPGAGRAAPATAGATAGATGAATPAGALPPLPTPAIAPGLYERVALYTQRLMPAPGAHPTQAPPMPDPPALPMRTLVCIPADAQAWLQARVTEVLHHYGSAEVAQHTDPATGEHIYTLRHPRQVHDKLHHHELRLSHRASGPRPAFSLINRSTRATDNPAMHAHTTSTHHYHHQSDTCPAGTPAH